MRLAYAASAIALAGLVASCNSSQGEEAAHNEHGEAQADAAHDDGHADAHADPHGSGHDAPAHDASAQSETFNPHAISLGPSSAHAAPAHAAHWSYRDQQRWATFSAESAMCAHGERQSPINFEAGATITDLPDLHTFYVRTAGAFINNGHTLQFTPAADPSRAQTLTLGENAYSVLQFHFHSPSEHSLDRRAYPLELHFVHKNAADQLAVLGVFFEEGPENPGLAALLAAMPAGEGAEFTTQLELDPNALLPADRTYFAYAGSLTTPPCSEGVRWSVLRTPVTASAAQIASLREALGASARHPQPLNTRLVALGF